MHILTSAVAHVQMIEHAVHSGTHGNVCGYVYIYMCVHIYIYVCIYIYVYINIHINTYVYIYIYIHYRSKVWGHPDNFKGGSVWFLMKYLHRCLEAHLQQRSLQCSNGTLCLLIALED